MAESEAVGFPVTHELDPRRGRSTPGFGLPAEELDILAVEDRGTERVEARSRRQEQLAVAARPACAIR